MRDKKIKKFTNKFSCKKAATNQKLLDTRNVANGWGGSESHSTEKTKMAMAQDILSVCFLCLAVCTLVYMDNPFPVSCQKNCYISLCSSCFSEIYFLQAQGRTPPIIFICSDKHQLLLLPLRIHEMKNEDMLTCRRRGNAVRWFSCENLRYTHSACHFIILESSLQTSEKSSQPSGKYKK